MQPVHTYKALSNRIMILGYLPSDFGFVVLSTVVVLSFVSSVWIPVVWFISMAYVFKKLKSRPERYFGILSVFLTMPRLLKVTTDDIPAYATVKQGAHAADTAQINP